MKVASSALAASRERRHRSRRVRLVRPAGAEPLEPRVLLSISPTADNAPPATEGIPDVSVDEDAPDTVIDLYALFNDDTDPDELLYFSVAGVTGERLLKPSADPKTGKLTLH